MPQLKPAGGHYKNQTLRITDLTVTETVLHGLTFEGCHLIGPAVLALLNDITMSENSFEGPPDAVIWEVPEGRVLLGVIGLDNCAFYGCRFTNVSLALPPDLASTFRRDLGGGSD